MTTRARSGVRRSVLGSVAEHVVAECPCPTVLSHAGAIIPHSLRTVLVTIDVSCAAPLSTLIELATGHDLRVVLLRVVAAQDLSIWQWRSGPVLDEPELVVVAREQLDDVASGLHAAGIRFVAHIAVASAVSVIDAFAERINADLIVMASHARMGTGRRCPG